MANEIDYSNEQPLKVVIDKESKMYSNEHPYKVVIVGGSAGGEGKIVDELPEEGEGGYIYLVLKEKSSEGNIYDEFMWVEKPDGSYGWEHIGATNEVEIEVDNEMSDTSENPVQNKVVKEYVDGASKNKKVTWQEIVDAGYETVLDWASDNMQVGESATVFASGVRRESRFEVVWANLAEGGQQKTSVDIGNTREWTITFVDERRYSWSDVFDGFASREQRFEVRYVDGPLMNFVRNIGEWSGVVSVYVEWSGNVVYESDIQDLVTYSDRWGGSSGVLSAGAGGDMGTVLGAALNIDGLTEPEPIMPSSINPDTDLVIAQAEYSHGEWWGGFNVVNGVDFDNMNQGESYWVYFKDHNGLPMNFATRDNGYYKDIAFNYTHDGERKQVVVSTQFYVYNTGEPLEVAAQMSYGRLLLIKKFDTGEIHIVNILNSVVGYKQRKISAIGDLTTLETESKADLVSAINELNQKMGAIENGLADLTTGDGV